MKMTPSTLRAVIQALTDRRAYRQIQTLTGVSKRTIGRIASNIARLNLSYNDLTDGVNLLIQLKSFVNFLLCIHSLNLLMLIWSKISSAPPRFVCECVINSSSKALY